MRETHMHNHVALFKFNLSSGQSIGPTALRTLWSRACESTDISVSRQTYRAGSNTKNTYLLHASPRLKDLSLVEARLRLLMNESRLLGTLTAVHN
jgi:hypothetical protein